MVSGESQKPFKTYSKYKTVKKSNTVFFFYLSEIKIDAWGVKKNFSFQTNESSNSA